MKKRLLSLLLCLCICVPMLASPALAAANKISVADARYYENSGDVKSLTINFGWDTASASSRLTVMTERLRSAGESGTNKSYGDFTDYGYYGKSFTNWNAVLSNSSKFGILYYTDEQKITSGKTNTFSVGFDQGDIPLDVDGTYYLYLWTSYGGYYYPDNLFMVLQVKSGTLQYAPATGRNSYGSFSVLKETSSAPSSGSSTTAPANKPVNFTDVQSSDYFATPVSWAVSNGITNGTSATTFSPNQTCTRAHIITFLWRAAGSPTNTGFLMNPYTDISENDYFYYAALWAMERGMVEGYQFKPNTPCTRGSTVEYLWKYSGWQNVESIPFSDVNASSTQGKAVSWAVKYGVTNGTGGTTFSPDATVTRGQIVTFLYRYFVAPLDNSALIASLQKPSDSTPTTEKLDPIPPEDYRQQPDWYGSLTPPDTMSNARLVAEYEQLSAVIEDRRARGIYMSDGPYSRELDLWSQLSQRCDIVKSYDRAIKNGDPAAYIVQEYNELIAKYGDAEPLRNCEFY